MLQRIHLWRRVPLLLVFCVFAVSLSLVHSQNPDRQNPEDKDAAFRKIIEEHQKSASAQQMAPTVSRTKRISTETLDESFSKLSLNDDDQYTSPGYTTNVLGENTEIHELLSNRRVIKILQEFEKLPRDQAKIKALKFHKDALDSLSKVLNVEFEPYDPKKIYAFIRPNEKFTAMTSVLLSASLRDIPLVTQRIEEWEQLTTKVREQLIKKNFPPDKADKFSKLFFLDATSHVSLLMFAAQRKGVLPDVLQIQLSGCQIMDIPLVAWDAPITYYDNRRFGGSPASLENIYMVFRVYNLSVLTEEHQRKNAELIQLLNETVKSLK